MDIKETAVAIHDNAQNKGFWRDYETYSIKLKQCTSTDKELYQKAQLQWITVMLALIGTEVSEAIEGLRKGDYENFGEEIADIVIRAFDLAEGLGIDIESEIKRKMEINNSREHKHGKKF